MKSYFAKMRLSSGIVGMPENSILNFDSAWMLSNAIRSLNGKAPRFRDTLFNYLFSARGLRVSDNELTM